LARSALSERGRMRLGRGGRQSRGTLAYERGRNSDSFGGGWSPAIGLFNDTNHSIRAHVLLERQQVKL
jgi:hypothetical protein